MAARLEQHAAAGEILLGETTYRLVRGAVDADLVVPFTVKGRADPVTAWRLRHVTPDASWLQRRLDAPSSAARRSWPHSRTCSSNACPPRADWCRSWRPPGWASRVSFASSFSGSAGGRG